MEKEKISKEIEKRIILALVHSNLPPSKVCDICGDLEIDFFQVHFNEAIYQYLDNKK